MGSFTKLVSSFFIVLLLLLSTGIMGGTEARMCESASHKYKGVCARGSNCANVCRGEGFMGGECRGFRRRCFCTKHC